MTKVKSYAEEHSSSDEEELKSSSVKNVSVDDQQCDSRSDGSDWTLDSEKESSIEDNATNSKEEFEEENDITLELSAMDIQKDGKIGRKKKISQCKTASVRNQPAKHTGKSSQDTVNILHRCIYFNI